jgi:hypothetical protein
MIEKDYLDKLLKRRLKTRVFKDFQHTGLALSQILEDQKHKSFYIKLAKYINKQDLISIAKDVAERKNIANKGAYFMELIKQKGLLDKLKKENLWKKKKKKEKSGQLKLKMKNRS